MGPPNSRLVEEQFLALWKSHRGGAREDKESNLLAHRQLAGHVHHLFVHVH